MQLVVCDPRIRIVEPVPIKIEYASRLAGIREADGGAVFELVQDQTCHEAGRDVFVLCHRVFLPWGSIGPGVEMTTSFMARRAVSIAGQRLLRLVKA